MIEYLQENYVWFIVGGIVILMAIIGYFADKTDFGRKELRKRIYEEAPKDKPEEKEEPVKEPKKKEKNKEKKKKKKSNEESNDNIVNIDQIVEEQTSNDVKEEVVENNMNIDEELFAPLTDTTSDFEDALVSESEVLTEVESEPLVETSEEVSPVAEEEDIWKF